MQVVDAKQAGAAGVLGVIANVLGKGTPLVSSFTAAIGLDAPVEVSLIHDCHPLHQIAAISAVMAGPHMGYVRQSNQLSMVDNLMRHGWQEVGVCQLMHMQ